MTWATSKMRPRGGAAASPPPQLLSHLWAGRAEGRAQGEGPPAHPPPVSRCRCRCRCKTALGLPVPSLPGCGAQPGHLHGAVTAVSRLSTQRLLQEGCRAAHRPASTLHQRFFLILNF